jgi:hypothetical protein
VSCQLSFDPALRRNYYWVQNSIHLNFCFAVIKANEFSKECGA